MFVEFISIFEWEKLKLTRVKANISAGTMNIRNACIDCVALTAMVSFYYLMYWALPKSVGGIVCFDNGIGGMNCF
jgi:hypothetical protein